MPPAPRQQSRHAAVEHKKAAPNLRCPPRVAHALGWQVWVLQSGEAFDHGLLGKQAAAEHHQHQRIDGNGIPIHRIRQPENQNGGEKRSQQQRNRPLPRRLRHGGADQPQHAHGGSEPEKRAVFAPVIPQKRIGETGEGEQDFGKGHGVV